MVFIPPKCYTSLARASLLLLEVISSFYVVLLKITLSASQTSLKIY